MSGRKRLTEQLERVPMDRRLRDAIEVGVKATDDATAVDEATQLKEALDAVPSLARQLRDAIAGEAETGVASTRRVHVGKVIRIRQVRSGIGCPVEMRETLEALGLGKMHRIAERTDTRRTRELIAKIPHLIQILD